MIEKIKSTTILAVLHKNTLVMVGDGQVTLQNTILKHNARKIRTLQGGKILAGFAGSAADAMTLFERFESKLRESAGQLSRACVELAKDWRNDKFLRRLEAMMIVGDIESLYLLSGNGDVIQPDEGILSVGSGSGFALAAARALLKANGDQMSARNIAELAMSVAANMCPYTNSEFSLEEVKL